MIWLQLITSILMSPSGKINVLFNLGSGFLMGKCEAPNIQIWLCSGLDYVQATVMQLRNLYKVHYKLHEFDILSKNSATFVVLILL